MNDLIIIGGGPAGLTASIYASCYHLKHLLVSKDIGGQVNFAPDILNYPGFDHVTGKELIQRMTDQAKNRGCEIVTASVTKISKPKIQMTNQTQNANDKTEDCFEIETLEGIKYQAKSIILATGTERRKLGVKGEVEYTGKGVHYCATCEKQDYQGKVCAVVGGGNAAVQAAVELAQAAGKVYIVYRGKELRGDAVWLEVIGKNKQIEVIYSAIVEEIIGDGMKINGIIIKLTDSSQQSTKKTLNIDKVFIEIGGVPGTALVIPLGVEMDKGGYIKVDEKLATSIPGVFAAGDMVSSGLSIEQISSAVGLGARAAASAFFYVKKDKAPSVWGTSQIKR
jgi:thioredoxin reductase (NADPH)